MTFLDSLFSAKVSDHSVGSVVGIDVGASSIKVVELSDRAGVITLVTYGEVQLGPYAGQSVGAAAKLSPQQEQTALVDVVRESAVQSRNAVFAMPLSSSFVTNVSLAADPQADLSALVRVEARKVIPASLSEVTLDWAELSNKTAQDGRRELLIAAIQNQALERFKILMQFAGLNDPPTEIECFSAIRSLYKSTETSVGIIDVGAASTKLYLTHQGSLVRMHRMRAGGVVATRRIAEVLDTDFVEAETMKCTADQHSAQFADIKRAHHSSYERPLREFAKVIKEYEDTTGHTLDMVYLTGGGGQFPDFPALMREALGREVVLAQPFSKVAYPAFMEDTMRHIGSSFTVALGAALRVFEQPR